MMTACRPPTSTSVWHLLQQFKLKPGTLASSNGLGLINGEEEVFAASFVPLHSLDLMTRIVFRMTGCCSAFLWRCACFLFCSGLWLYHCFIWCGPRLGCDWFSPHGELMNGCLDLCLTNKRLIISDRRRTLSHGMLSIWHYLCCFFCYREETDVATAVQTVIQLEDIRQADMEIVKAEGASGCCLCPRQRQQDHFELQLLLVKPVGIMHPERGWVFHHDKKVSCTVAVLHGAGNMEDACELRSALQGIAAANTAKDADVAQSVCELTNVPPPLGGGSLAALLAKGGLGQALGADPTATNGADALNSAQLALRVVQFVFGAVLLGLQSKIAEYFLREVGTYFQIDRLSLAVAVITVVYSVVMLGLYATRSLTAFVHDLTFYMDLAMALLTFGAGTGSVLDSYDWAYLGFALERNLLLTSMVFLYSTFAAFAASLVITRLRGEGSSAGARAKSAATEAMPILRAVQLVTSVAAVGTAGYIVHQYLYDNYIWTSTGRYLTRLPTEVSLLFAVAVIVAAYSLVWLCVHAAGTLRSGALEACFYLDLATLALAFGAALRAAPTDFGYGYTEYEDTYPDTFIYYTSLSGRPAIKASIAFMFLASFAVAGTFICAKIRLQ